MNAILKHIEQFHGHLGPYAVIGFKMGEIANELLGDDSFSKQAHVSTGRTPPLSCIIDGIQLSSGCTMGKGNITVSPEGVPRARFIRDGKQVDIRLKHEIQQEIDTTVTKENIITYSTMVFQKPNDELFTITHDL